MCICTRLCAKYLIYIIRTSHTLKDECHYLYYTEKKIGILGEEGFQDSHSW